MDAETLRAELVRLSHREGLRALGRRLGLDPGYLSRVCAGLQPPGPAILAALGYEAVTVYRRAKR